MLKRDYVERQIDQLAAAFKRIVQLLSGGQAEKAKEELEATASAGGMDLALIRMLPMEALVQMLSPGGEPDPGRCWYAAELLYLDGQRAAAQDDAPGARDAFGKSLRLFLLATPRAMTPVGAAEAGKKIEELLGWLGEPLPPSLAEPVAAFRAGP